MQKNTKSFSSLKRKPLIIKIAHFHNPATKWGFQGKIFNQCFLTILIFNASRK
jgi:hypothetical protein